MQRYKAEAVAEKSQKEKERTNNKKTEGTSNRQGLHRQGAKSIRLEDDAHTNLGLKERVT
jgi:hypothetical protein